MSQIVRRVNQTPVAADVDDDALPERVHPGEGISVRSRLSLGIDPKLRFSWEVDWRFRRDGYTLLVFHSTAGFSPEKYPDDNGQHGQLIIETTRNDSYEERPTEGTHFYTFLLQKMGFLGIRWSRSVVRFSETIPTAKIAIGRIQDKMQLQDLLRRHELDEIEFEAKVNEARIRRHLSAQKLRDLDKPAKAPVNSADAMIANEIDGIDAILNAYTAKRKKVEELKKDPRFTKLSKSERQAILNEVETRLDAAEIAAMREMRKS